MNHKAILRLDEAVHTCMSLLNKSYPICIGLVDGVCYLPSGCSFSGAKLAAPFSNIDLPENIWGMANCNTSITIEALLLSFEVEDDVDVERLYHLARETSSWGRRLRDWLAFLSDGPTTPLWDYPGIQWLDQGIDESICSHGYREGRFHQPYKLNRWQWEHALKRASAEIDPPLARNLLIRAERAAFENSRQAVFDAATATEIAITTGLHNCLCGRGTSSNIIEALLDRARMIGARIALAKELDMELPDRIMPDLVTVRNKAVHAGHSISAEQAWAAVKIARWTVDKFEPLDPYCEEEIQAYGLDV